MCIELKNLVGSHILSGIDLGAEPLEDGMLANYVKFTLDGITYRVNENPEDGFRSWMQDPQIVAEPCKIQLPNVLVNCGLDPDTCSEILIMTDMNDGLEIMRIGTYYNDELYPTCIFNWYPENLPCNMDVPLLEQAVETADAELDYEM